MDIVTQRWTARQLGILLSLFAVVLQFATVLTHHHASQSIEAQICGTPQARAAQNGCSGSSGGSPHQHSDGSCGLCSLLAQSRSAIEPEILAVLRPLEWHRTLFPALTAPEQRSNRLLVLRTRGPPPAAIT